MHAEGSQAVGNAGIRFFRSNSVQIFLDELRTDMDIDLHERRIADALEAVHLTRLDDENVARSRLEFLAIHRVEPAALSNELNFVVRMSVRPGALPGLCIEQKR